MVLLLSPKPTGWYGDEPGVREIFVCGKCDTPLCRCGKLFQYSGVQASYDTATLKAWGIDAERSMFDIVRDFYGALSCYMIAEGTFKDKNVLNSIIEPIAKNLLNALMISIMGEARYNAPATFHSILWRAKPKYRKHFLDTPAGQFAKMMVDSYRDVYTTGYHANLGHISLEGAGSRDGVTTAMLPFIEKYGQARTARIIRSGYVNYVRFSHKRETSTGGLTWANSADVAYQYASGKWSSIMFVDAVCDLVHNGGPTLNKVWNYIGDAAAILMLKKYLDPEDMALYAPNTIRAQFGLPSVKPTPAVLIVQDALIVRNRFAKSRHTVLRPVPRKFVLWAHHMQTLGEIKPIKFEETREDGKRWRTAGILDYGGTGAYLYPKVVSKIGEVKVTKPHGLTFEGRAVPLNSMNQNKIRKEALERITMLPQSTGSSATHKKGSDCPLCGPKNMGFIL